MSRASSTIRFQVDDELAHAPSRRPYGVLGAHLGPWLPLVTVLGLAIVLGQAIIIAGPLMAAMGVAGLVLVGLAFTHPEVVILLVFALASGLLPAQANPFVSLPVGSFQVSDLFLFLLLGIVVVRALVEPSFQLIKTPLDVPLLVFFGTIVLGLGVAVFGFGVNFSNATYEARMLSYYLLFFAVTNLVRTRAQLIRLVVGLVVIAVLLALLMLVTSAVGSLPGYTTTWAQVEQGVARVFHPGFTVVYVALMVVLSYGALSGRTRSNGRLRWLVITILGLGLLSTLARNILVAGVSSIALLFIVLRRRERSRLATDLAVLVTASAILILGLLALGEAGPLLRYGNLYLARLGRMFSSNILSQGENLQPRWVEIQYAWAKLLQHPLLGIGLYNAYRPPFYRGEPVTLQHFLHNAYLAIWLKAGLVGLSSFLWLAGTYLVRGFRYWNHVQDRLLKAAALGSVVAFVAFLLSNFVAPTFVQPGSLAVFGLILGMNESIMATSKVSNTMPSGEYREGGISYESANSAHA